MKALTALAKPFERHMLRLWQFFPLIVGILCLGCSSRDRATASKSSTRAVEIEPEVRKTKPSPRIEFDVDPGQTDPTALRELEASVAKLRQLKVLDFPTGSYGGPYVAFGHNDVTLEIVGKGRPVIPVLLKRLEVSEWDESVFIVFCLRKLRARSAESQLREIQKALRAHTRFTSTPHDFTLDVQIQNYLEEVDSW